MMRNLLFDPDLFLVVRYCHNLFALAQMPFRPRPVDKTCENEAICETEAIRPSPRVSFLQEARMYFLNWKLKRSELC